MKEGKAYYQAPLITVVNVNTEGVVCSSPGNAGSQNYNWHDEEEE